MTADKPHDPIYAWWSFGPHHRFTSDFPFADRRNESKPHGG